MREVHASGIFESRDNQSHDDELKVQMCVLRTGTEQVDVLDA